MAGNQDMGTGSVKKWMVQLAVPAVVGQVINLLYNVVDRIYIGHIPEIGGAALTGVGLFALGAAKKEKGEKLTKAELPYRNLNDTTPPSGGVALLFTFPPKKATI